MCLSNYFQGTHEIKLNINNYQTKGYQYFQTEVKNVVK